MGKDLSSVTFGKCWKMNYSNEEVQQILENLFEEKKKAKRLLQELTQAAHERTLLEEKIDKANIEIL